MKLIAVGFDEKRVYPIPVPLKADRARWCAAISTLMQSIGIAQLRCSLPVVCGIHSHSKPKYRAFLADIPQTLLDLQPGVADTLHKHMELIGMSELTLEPEAGEIEQLEKFWNMTVQSVAPKRQDTDPGKISILEETHDRRTETDGNDRNPTPDSGSDTAAGNDAGVIHDG